MQATNRLDGEVSQDSLGQKSAAVNILTDEGG